VKIVINQKALKALQEGFLWVYRSDIILFDRVEPGSLVEAVDRDGKFVALGYFNPKSVISFRALAFKRVAINTSFFIDRIQKALLLRKDIPSNAKRLIHSEGDLLPGLIVDDFNGYFVVWLGSAGMVRLKPFIIEALKLLKPKGMIIGGDEKVLQKEGIELKQEVIGKVPQKVTIQENGIFFEVDLFEGQKTGFYLDQRRNRKVVSEYIEPNQRVLDLFSNIGGFGLYGAKKGADVTLVDISATVIEQAKQNFALNGVEGEFIVANVFDYLRHLRKKKEKFDLIIIDPPAFAKTKAKKEGALRGFKDLVVNALKLNPTYIALFSCSYAVELEDLKKVVIKACKDTQKRAWLLEHCYQDKDHPYLINMPNTLYLKGFLAKIESV